MRRAIVGLAILAAVIVTGAAAGHVLNDPRVCGVPNTPVKECARENAIGALRAFMARKESKPGWDATINCTGNQHWLRWYCTFRDETEKGSAVITLGKAPSWTRHVVLNSYAVATPSPGPGG